MTIEGRPEAEVDIDPALVRALLEAQHWTHEDLHPGNLLVSGGRLSAVIDFGDLCSGDPATDLSVAWMLLPSSARSGFRTSVRGSAERIDDGTWLRARGWALALGLAHLAGSRDNAIAGQISRATIETALRDDVSVL